MKDTILEGFLDQAIEQESSIAISNKEMVQHLSDLGYLHTDFLADFNFDRKVDEALGLFMLDIERSKLFNNSDILKYRTLFPKNFKLELLRSITDIDEGLQLTHLPVKGEISLITRMIHYRLEIMGLYNRKVSSPFGEYSTIMLKDLKTTCGFISVLDGINALADIESFTKRVIRKQGRENCIIVCKPSLSEEEKQKFKINRVFKKQLKRDFEHKSEFYKLLKEKVLRRNENNIDINFLEIKHKKSLNNLLLRLIQIHQWKDGFYDGLLDTDFGPLMFNSILDLTIAFNNEKEDDDIQAKSVLAYVGFDYVIFNALFFLEKYMLEDKKENYQIEVINRLNYQLQTATKQEQLKFETSSNHYIQEAKKNIDKENEKSKNGFFKRIYYGVKGFFKKLFRIGKKLFRWIVENVKRAAKFLKNFFKSMLTHLKRALQFFINGIKFILGKEEVVSQSDNKLVMSKFYLDMDNFHIFPSSLTNSNITKHLYKVKESLLSLQFSFSVVGKLLKIVLNMANMVTWPILLINLVKVFKQLTQEYNQIEVELKQI